jgi:hypothetical protein
VRDETAGDIVLIWVTPEQEYFCKQDWTGEVTLIPFKKSR